MKLDINKVYEWSGPCSFCKGTGIDRLKKAFKTKWDQDVSCWHCDGTGDACSEEEQHNNRLKRVAKLMGKTVEEIKEQIRQSAEEYRKLVPEGTCDTCEGRGEVIINWESVTVNRVTCPDCGGTGKDPLNPPPQIPTPPPLRAVTEKGGRDSILPLKKRERK